MNYAVIMAGGSGTRFWPLSRKALPKQFLTLFGNASLIRQTYERIRPVFPPERILVITNADYVHLVQAQLPEIPVENIFGEPRGRNTAPCIAFASEILLHRDPDAVMAVLPSDHTILNEDLFLETIQIGMDAARDNGGLYTIGIEPNRPETGYGYIQHETVEGSPVSLVRTFAEKPDLETAKAFLRSGDFLWNSGMFIWRADTIRSEIQHHLPMMGKLAAQLSFEIQTIDTITALQHFYDMVQSISIDYGVMEKAENVCVIPADFGWNDVGSWAAAWELAEKDEHGNSVNGTGVEVVNSRNCYVRASGDRLIALVGLEDIVVVDSGDALLIMPSGKSQEIRDLVDRLDQQNSPLR